MHKNRLIATFYCFACDRKSQYLKEDVELAGRAPLCQKCGDEMIPEVEHDY